MFLYGLDVNIKNKFKKIKKILFCYILEIKNILKNNNNV